MRIVALSKENNGLDSRVTAHPRMAPYFIVVDVDDSGNISSVRAIPNPYAEDEREHVHGHEHPGRGGVGGAEHDEHEHVHGLGRGLGRGGGRGGGAGFFHFLASLRPDAVVTYTIGSGAFYRLREMGIRIYKPRRTVGESVRALLAGELEEMLEPAERR